MTNATERKALIQYIISMVIFGSNGLVASFISLNSYEIVLIRAFIGSIVLTGVFFLTGHSPSFYKHKKQFACLLVSGVAMVSSWMFQFEAYEHVGVSIATLLYYAGPVIVLIISPFLFGEKLTAAKVSGFAAVIIGVLLVNGRLTGNIKPFGVFCGLMSAVMYAVMVAFNKQAKDIDGLEVAMLQLIIGFSFVFCFVGIKQGFAINLLPTDIPPLLLLGIINTGFTCYIYFTTIKKLKVQTVALCGYIDLLASVFFSVAFLGERLTAIQILGAIFILGGAMGGEMSTIKH